MTTTTARPGQAPARRADLALGPPLLRGAAPVHLVKDPRSGRRHELGPREHFVLSRLDGTATRDEIGAAYAAVFGRRLGDGAWGQLLGLFWSRDLLDTLARALDASTDQLQSVRGSAWNSVELRRAS